MPFLCFKLKTDNKIENHDPTVFCPLKMMAVAPVPNTEPVRLLVRYATLTVGDHSTWVTSKFASLINDWVYYDHENNVNIIIKGHNLYKLYLQNKNKFVKTNIQLGFESTD